MSARATEAGSYSPATERGELGPTVRPARVKTHWRIAEAVGLVLVSALILFGAEIRRVMANETPPRPTIASGLAVMPSKPTDGVLTMVIPPGAAADQQAGGRGYEMPSVISLTRGDTIVIRNDDDEPHKILYAFLAAGVAGFVTQLWPRAATRPLRKAVSREDDSLQQAPPAAPFLRSRVPQRPRRAFPGNR